MKLFAVMFALVTFSACQGQKNDRVKPASQEPKPRIVRTDQEWKKVLTPAQYHVLRGKGTERPFTGEYDQHFEKGHYACAACGQKLFASQTKYDAGCGWPSFDQALKGAVTYHVDNSLGMERTEVLCSACGGHLGHVFDDGPKKTTGQRYCMNSVSLQFVPER